MENRTLSKPKFNYTRQGIIIDVHDGDTVTLAIKMKKTRMKDQDLGYHVHVERGWITLHTAVRFYGINAPELNTDAGIVARDFLQSKLPVGAEVRLMTALNPGDKYGRWLGILYYQDVNLNDLMLSSGNAVVFV